MNDEKKKELRKILVKLSPQAEQTDFLIENIEKLDKFINQVIEKTDNIIQEKEQTFNQIISSLVDELNEYLVSVEKQTDSKLNQLDEEIKEAKEFSDIEIKDAIIKYKKDIEKTSKSIIDKIDSYKKDILSIVDLNVDKLKSLNSKTKTEIQEMIDKVMPELKKHTTQEIANRLSINAKLAGNGGGNMNRNISIGGNSSVMSRYTDLNIKAGSNVTLSYSNNDTTKNLDLTIAATGGSGLSRSVNSISTSQNAGSTANTDYVYVCSAGIQLTLPTAVSNTNLYTVKNISSSSVLVNTTSAQTIDGQSNIILATQYTSVDIISDSANWDLT